MRFYVDNSTGQLTPGPGQIGNVATAQNPITITGGTLKLVELQFLDPDASGVPSVPARKPSGFTISWGLKTAGDFNGVIPAPTIISAASLASASKTISANSLANPSVVTTTAAHGFTTGDVVTIAGSNSTPVIDGTRVVTVLTSTTFSVAVNVTIAGTAGTAQRPTVVTTTTPHGLATGDTVTITGSNSTPTINGSNVAAVISPTTFSIPVIVTVAGTAGSVQGPLGFICSVASFTRPATDAEFYTAYLETNTVPIVTALENDVPLIELAGEINVKDPAANDPDKTDYVYLTVRNWYSQGAEGVPVNGAPPYPSAEALNTLLGTSYGTMAAQNANAVVITGGTSDSVTHTNEVYDGATIDTSGGGIQINSGITGLTMQNGSDIFIASGTAFGCSSSGKSIDIQNSLIFTGTDGSTLNVAGGGTLGTAAFTAAAAYVAAGAVVSSGLTQTTARLLGRTTASTGAIEQITVGAGLTFTAGNLAVTSPYDSTAVAITGGTIGGASIVATTLGASGLSSLLGGLKLTYAQKTSTYTFLGSDYAIEATSGTFALNLLTAVGRIGQPFLVINSGSGVITLSTTGGQTINGLSTIAIPQGASFEVTSTGANWVITGEYGATATGSFTTLTASGATTFTAGTGSSSVTTGTVVVTGGVGVSGTVWAGTLTTDGNINAAVAGKGLTVKGGTGGRIGTVTLVGGTSGAISIPSITTSSRPQLQRVTAGGTLGAGGYDYTISAGTSLTIFAVDLTGVLSALDTSTVSYFIPEQT